MNPADDQIRYAFNDRLEEWAAGNDPDLAKRANEELARRRERDADRSSAPNLSVLGNGAASAEDPSARMAKDIRTIRNVVLFWFWCGIIGAICWIFYLGAR